MKAYIRQNNCFIINFDEDHSILKCEIYDSVIHTGQPRFIKPPSLTKDYYVYALNRDSHVMPFYIGVGTSKSGTFRPNAHIQEALSNNKYQNIKCKIIRKCINNKIPLYLEIVGQFDCKEDSLLLEKELIESLGKLHDNTGVLSNIIDGGKITPPSDGENNYCFGKFGQEHPAYGIKHSKESILNRSLTYKKNNKLYNYNKGKRNGRYNDHRSWEEIHGKEKADLLKKVKSLKYSGEGNPNSKKSHLISPDNTEHTFNCRKSFCKEHDLIYSMISKVIRGEIPSWKGWHV